MPEIWKSLVPILLADVLNPVLFAFMVYAAGSSRPVLNSSAMLVGHTAAYLGAGIALGFGMESIAERLANPKQIDYAIEMFVGLVLLWVALKSRGAEPGKPEERAPPMTTVGALGYGVVINFIGIPFAVPYFAALSQILKSDPTFAEALALLIGYNLLYALPFAIVPAVIAVMGDRGRPVLQRISGALDRVAGVLMPVVLALVALALIADAATYFSRGESLF